MSIKTTFRSLSKDRRFTIINIIGLSTGLACALLIFLWINDENSVDKFNANDARLYQVLKNSQDGEGNMQTRPTTQGLLASSMARELPEIEYAVSVKKDNTLGVATVNDKHIKAKLQFADKDFFKLFSYEVVEGNKKNCLSDPSGVLISEKLANQLFNTTTGLIGKTITWDHGDQFNGDYSITGVYKDPPSNASDQFDLLFPYSLYVQKEAGTMGDVSFWGSNSVNTYLTLKNGVDPQQFGEKIKDYTQNKIKTLYSDKGLLKYEGTLLLQKYSDNYLYNRFEIGKQSGGRIEYVRLFYIIALFILVIACINFMNLSTAKAAKRIKDAGIKKIVGATRTGLIMQYIGESVLMSFIALLIAVVLAFILLTPFRELTGKTLHIQFNLPLVVSIVGITLLTGIIAGSYPAFFLSGFKPAIVLKGKLNVSRTEAFIRKGLVVFQFGISAILIISVLVVYRQMNLIQTTNLGYAKDNIIHFATEGSLNKDPETFITEVQRVPGVVAASSMDGDMTGTYSQSGGGISWEGKSPNQGVEFEGLDMNYGMMELLGLRITEGRAFSKEYGSDSNSVILNQTAINAMRIKNPIGKTITMWGHPKQIIGVVKDFHFQSFYQKVMPFFLRCTRDNSNIFVKIKAGKQKETLAALDKFYTSFNMGIPFEYKFIDDDYQQLYASESRIEILARYFAGIAIIISCLGLFGLAAFTAQRRQKEIGIRKVVGASVSGVVVMLSKDFVKLVIIALLIAVPVAWWAANQWLQSFAYRINIGADIFIISAMSVLFITIITISYEAIRAAIANPVKSLGTE